MTELQWKIYETVILRDYFIFKLEQAEKELYALRILQLCLTGK